MTPKTWSFTFLKKEHDKILEKRILESQKGRSEYLRDVQLNALGLNSHLSSLAPSSFSPKRSEEEQGLPQETQSVSDLEIPCFCRFEHNGLLWCAKSAPKTAKLATLKICKACPKRLTKERIREENLLVQTRYYVTCGAKEHYDKKKGQMLYCEKGYGGQWVTPKDCQTAKCLDIKEVKGQW